ncbi:MAG: class B sortase, partial [Acetatifactor sp.]|nr:class B sortase [Acetatifactor sp.]
EDYRDTHPYLYLSTKSERHVYEVIAAFQSQVFYKTDDCFKFYKFFQADTEEEFLDFYENIKALSYYKNEELSAEFGDKFVTLSTCSYHVDNGRFVVVAKEIEIDKLYN